MSNTDHKNVVFMPILFMYKLTGISNFNISINWIWQSCLTMFQYCLILSLVNFIPMSNEVHFCSFVELSSMTSLAYFNLIAWKSPRMKVKLQLLFSNPFCDLRRKFAFHLFFISFCFLLFFLRQIYLHIHKLNYKQNIKLSTRWNLFMKGCGDWTDQNVKEKRQRLKYC